jgi:hypothetical protein
MTFQHDFGFKSKLLLTTPGVLKRRSQQTADSRELIRVLRRAAMLANCIANATREARPRARLFHIEQRVDEHLRRLLKQIPPEQNPPTAAQPGVKRNRLSAAERRSQANLKQLR